MDEELPYVPSPEELQSKANAMGRPIGPYAANKFHLERLMYFETLSNYNQKQQKWSEAARWCRETFEHHSNANGVFAFRTKEDACYFKLRWG